MILVIGVHADDACFSAGEFIAQHAREEEVVVLTLCSGWPPGDGEAMAWQSHLNAEHYDACTFLGATAAGCAFRDGKWSPPRTEGDLTHLTYRLRKLSPDTVLVPLGIHHPDHVYFAPLAREAARRTKARVAVYEDLPYRVLYPEETIARWAEVLPLFEPLYPRHLIMESAANAAFYEKKLQACQMYRSQWGDDARRCVMAPERIYWVP